MRGLYAIIDTPHPHGIDPEAQLRAMLPADGEPGVSVIQLRAKRATTPERVALLRELGPPCAAVGVTLLVDDDLEAALAAGALVGGVHLGRGDPGFDAVESVRARARRAGRDSFVVGLSTHDLAQLRAACHQAPDYVAFGPVRATTSKARPDAVVGMDRLAEACRHAWRPVVAIGGLDRAAGVRAIEVGASAVAVIGAITRPTIEETRARARELARAFTAAAEPLDLNAVQERIPVFERQQLEELGRWSDDAGTHIAMGLPARFRPIVDERGVRYRPCDVLDLLLALDKRPDETWDGWRARKTPSGAADLVQIARFGPQRR